MTISEEKWPAIFNIVNVASSVLDEPLNLFFITGVMHKNQATEVKRVVSILSEIAIDDDKVVLTTLLNKGQLKSLYETFEPRSREWRGKYYALSKAIVEACQPYV